MKKLVCLIISVFLIFSMSSLAFADSFVDSGPGAAKWERQSNGRWMYKAGSTVFADKFVESKGCKYLLDPNGYMLTGWQYKDGSIYYLTETEIEGHPEGSLWTGGPTPDGRETDANGVLVGDLGCRPNPYHTDCIEVSIPEQQVYVYKGELLVMQTPCVTGKVSTGTITPEGDYAIQAKVPDKTLKGKNVDGTDYESFVHYWMPFHNWSYGLHDASWRGSFGGQIYQTGGSHGCVNLPTAAAAQLWGICYVGMPVHVHG